MTRYLISFDDGSMTFPDEDLPDVAAAAHGVLLEAKTAGVWVLRGRHRNATCEHRGHRRCSQRRPLPETKAVLGGFRNRGRLVAAGSTELGCQVRRGVPLCARGAGDHARSGRLTVSTVLRQGPCQRFWSAVLWTLCAVRTHTYVGVMNPVS